MKGMNKFFRAFCEDGSAEYLAVGEPNSLGLKISTDGMVHFYCASETYMEGFGAIIAGHSVCVSNFTRGTPDGESLLIQNNEIKRLNFKDGFIETDETLSGDYARDFYDSYLQNNALLRAVRDCEFFNLAPRLQWQEVLDYENMIEHISGLVRLDSGPNLIGYIDSEHVLLTRLPSQPPNGMIEITGGIQIKELDFWKRKVKKLSSHSFGRATTIVGFYNHEGDMCIVSTLPPAVEEFGLVIANTSHDCVVDAIQEVVQILQWLRAQGVPWNGILNRRCFITSCEGVIYLNTGYLLSQFAENEKIFGGFSSEELRFMSPNQIVRCSKSAKVILEAIGFQIPHPPSICSEELRNLGMFIYSLVVGEKTVPMHWLSDAQFVLASWLTCVNPETPIASVLSILCDEPVDIFHPEIIRMQDTSKLDPLLRIAHRLVTGNMTLDELDQSLQSYIKWRDIQATETSVETEVKAVFGRMSALFQSGQDAMKSAISKSIDNSW